MSETTARTDAQRQLAGYDQQLAEVPKLNAETHKLLAEQHKLANEAQMFLAEARHLDRQRSVAFVAATGAGAALPALILRLLGVIKVGVIQEVGGSDA